MKAKSQPSDSRFKESSVNVRFRLAALARIFCKNCALKSYSPKMFKQRIWFKSLRQAVSNNNGKLAHTSSESPQYDMSEKMQKLFETKHKQREATKAYYQKMIMNPYGPKITPVPFDPVLFRYNAFMSFHAEYYRPTMKSAGIFIGLYILPLFGLSWFFTSIKDDYDQQIRAGEVAYKDRPNKGFI